MPQVAAQEREQEDAQGSRRRRPRPPRDTGRCPPAASGKSLCQKPKSTHSSASTHHATSAALGKIVLWLAAKTAVRKIASRPVNAEHDAVEELAVAVALLELDRLPQQSAWQPVRRRARRRSDGLAALDAEAEDVRTVVRDAFGRETRRMRDRLDAPRVEVGPDHAGRRPSCSGRRQPAARSACWSDCAARKQASSDWCRTSSP